MAIIQNPILPGFHPDPSFIRVGDDFYIASSTFEWLPGVRFHHSKDLVNWRLAGHALTRPSQIDLKGVDNSNGVWAPSLSFSDGQFWLIYTNIRTSGMGRPFKDPLTFLITAPAIDGPWSDPIFLNAIGFDPSLFHDDDGRKWLVNMQWDFRKNRYRFAGNILQEYDPIAQKLIGPIHELVRKENVLCEGPNLYKHGGWYYLLMAEGGTGWNHGISMARSKTITGPYELDPAEAILTTRHSPEHPLQKAGHGELLQTASGEWWLAHLCSRPLQTGKDIDPKSPDQSSAAHSHAGHRCILGRETALQRVQWTTDGWLRLANGGVLPDVEVESPAELKPHSWPKKQVRDDFDLAQLHPEWSTLRVPADSVWLSLSARPGWARLHGRECPMSLHEQSIVAKRVTHFRMMAQTRIDFSPTRFTQFAGLVAWYDTRMFYYLRISHDEKLGKILGIIQMDDNVYDELDFSLRIENWSEIHLRCEIDGSKLQFSASQNETDWEKIGPVLDASKLSDDYATGLHFTGAFLGIACHDVAGQQAFADFDYFELKEMI